MPRIINVSLCSPPQLGPQLKDFTQRITTIFILEVIPILREILTMTYTPVVLQRLGREWMGILHILQKIIFKHFLMNTQLWRTGSRLWSYEFTLTDT